MGKKTKQRQLALLEKEQHFQHIIQKGYKSQKNPLNTLETIYQNRLYFGELPIDSPFYYVAQVMNGGANMPAEKDRKRFYLFLKTLLENRAHKMLADLALVTALYHVSRYWGSAVQELADWKMPCHNAYRSFGHLLRFLFAEYEVPVFMDNAFFEGNNSHINWYFLLARGRSLRKSIKLPIPLSAKGIHLFVTAPLNYKVNEALRYAQVLSLGGDERLVQHILGSKLSVPQQDEAFWETVIRFFIQNPMLDPVHIVPIVDFIQHKKFEGRRPEMPDFSMKGRTVASLLRMVEEWHHQLNWVQKGRMGKQQTEVWPLFQIPDFVYYEGKKVEGMVDENGEQVREKSYHITQLRSASELQQEGRAMQHCVASYAHSCKVGKTSIWSFTLNEWGVSKRLLTIELNRSHSIVQIRGKFNARANANELRIIEKWIQQQGLRMSKWA